MLSAVLDTNVLASGSLTSSTIPKEILRLWQEGSFKLYISNFIVKELKEVFNKPFFKKLISDQNTEDFIELLGTDAILVELKIKVKKVATHPEDDFVLATALNAEADYLVTGDRHLQDLKQFKSIKIVSPRIFSEILEEKKVA